MNSSGPKFGYRSSVLAATVAAASLGCVAFGPAAAEDTGLWEAFRSNHPGYRTATPGFRAVAPAPGFSVVLPSRVTAPKPQVVRLPSAPAAKLAWQDPSKRENPLASVLRDPTLRYGDIVVFPDGPRVFKGDPGERHALNDFVAVAAARDLPKASRKTLLAMPIGENTAWSSATTVANGPAAKGKIAALPADVEATGSIGASSGKTVTVRTGRGDVRVIRVPD